LTNTQNAKFISRPVEIFVVVVVVVVVSTVNTLPFTHIHARRKIIQATYGRPIMILKERRQCYFIAHSMATIAAVSTRVIIVVSTLPYLVKIAEIWWKMPFCTLSVGPQFSF
jgi:hypothetical protein